LSREAKSCRLEQTRCRARRWRAHRVAVGKFFRRARPSNCGDAWVAFELPEAPNLRASSEISTEAMWQLQLGEESGAARVIPLAAPAVFLGEAVPRDRLLNKL